MAEKKALWTALLPFSDAASDTLPLGRLLRLSLFQVSVGMATVMLLGTLNRVMIVELSTPAALVAAMVALPVLIAPFRALLGFRSDHYRSAIGWKRAPYLWFGALFQFGGLAITPFALLLLSGDNLVGPAWIGHVFAAIAFLMTGLGLHMTQTAGLALASDLATEETRPRVVALLYVMFLLGMAISAVVIGGLLADFSNTRLVQVVQGTAVATLALNLVALWRQERAAPMSREARAAPKPRFSDAWRDLTAGGRAGRLLAVVAIGTLGFSMQDVLLEPFGGQVLGLSVGATTVLTAIWAAGALGGFAVAARLLGRGGDPARVAASGLLAGMLAFSAVILADPLRSTPLFFMG
ncbi:MAG: BCD family MFS transporter, partial [Pseudomonadota bacterium]